MAGTGAPETTESDASTEVDLSRATILVVDDNQQNLELIQAYLEGLACRIMTAQDGAEAIAIIDRDTPDLVLLDVMMPRMSGFDVCKRVKGGARTKEIVVIMVTALHEVGDMERAVECGCDDFVSKPVNKVELLTRVKGLLRLKLLRQQLSGLLDRGHLGGREGSG